jgi:hypothetical protein
LQSSVAPPPMLVRLAGMNSVNAIAQGIACNAGVPSQARP